jgi:predicted amidohydrolase
VAACQVALDIDDPSGTQQRLGEAVRKAVRQGARLVVLPELASSGYCFRTAAEARAAAQPVDGRFVGWLSGLSAELGCVLVSGLCEASGSEVFNSAVVLQAGEILTVYRKVHLWGSEPQFFTPGRNRPAVVDTFAGRVAPMICYDQEFPEWIRVAADLGAELITVPANWPQLARPSGERPLEILKAQAFAGTYRVYIVIADRCGVERGQEWIGGSVIVGPDGYPLAGPASDGAEYAEARVLVADVDSRLAQEKEIGPHNDARRDRRPDLY